MKLAPALYKALYPTSTERQNVVLMEKTFNENNVKASKHLAKELNNYSSGTQVFLETMRKLCKILNVNHPGMGALLRDTFQNTIRFTSNECTMFI